MVMHITTPGMNKVHEVLCPTGFSMNCVLHFVILNNIFAPVQIIQNATWDHVKSHDSLSIKSILASPGNLNIFTTSS